MGLLEIIIGLSVITIIAVLGYVITLNDKSRIIKHKDGEKDFAYYWRVFKWFLIGNYRCENTNEYIWLYILLNKLFWSSNVILCSIGIGTIIQWIQ